MIRYVAFSSCVSFCAPQLTHVLFAFFSLRFLVTRFPLSSFTPLGMNTLSRPLCHLCINFRVFIIIFFNIRCGHCKRLAPKYEAAAVAMAKLRFVLALFFLIEFDFQYATIMTI